MWYVLFWATAIFIVAAIGVIIYALILSGQVVRDLTKRK